MPLKKQGKTIGTLSVQRYQPNSYTTDHLKLVEAVATQVAIAIENARLFTELQRNLPNDSRRKRARKIDQRTRTKKCRTRKVQLHHLARSAKPDCDDQGFSWHVDKDMQDNRPDRIQSDLQRIADAANKMDDLLRDLLELSRVGRLVHPPEEIDLAQLAREAAETVDIRLRARNIALAIAPDRR